MSKSFWAYYQYALSLQFTVMNYLERQIISTPIQSNNHIRIRNVRCKKCDFVDREAHFNIELVIRIPDAMVDAIVKTEENMEKKGRNVRLR